MRHLSRMALAEHPVPPRPRLHRPKAPPAISAEGGVGRVTSLSPTPPKAINREMGNSKEDGGGGESRAKAREQENDP